MPPPPPPPPQGGPCLHNQLLVQTTYRRLPLLFLCTEIGVNRSNDDGRHQVRCILHLCATTLARSWAQASTASTTLTRSRTQASTASTTLARSWTQASMASTTLARSRPQASTVSTTLAPSRPRPRQPPPPLPPAGPRPRRPPPPPHSDHLQAPHIAVWVDRQWTTSGKVATHVHVYIYVLPSI